MLSEAPWRTSLSFPQANTLWLSTSGLNLDIETEFYFCNLILKQTHYLDFFVIQLYGYSECPEN